MHTITLSKILRWFNPLLGFFLIISVFYLIRIILSSQEIKLEAPVSQKKTERHRSLSIDDYAALLKDNPFGLRGEFRLLTKTESSPPESSITLIGTVAGGDYDYAIFVDSSGRQEIFRKGQDVYGIGRLKAVYKNKIVLKTDTGDKVYEIADIVITEVRSQKAEAGGPSGLKPLSGVARTSQNVFTINSEALRQAIENPREILTDARFIPNIVDGRQEGFIVRELKKGGVYESLGLEDGDILLRVNEFPITGPESALQAFTALKGMDRIELDIMRRGQRISMTYQIR